jgi:hypothetical protein
LTLVYVGNGVYIDTTRRSIDNLAVHPGLKKTGAWLATGTPVGTAGWGLFDNGFSSIAVSTGAHTGITRNAISGINGGTSYKETTGATGASLIGWKGSFAGAPLTRQYQPRFDLKVKLAQTTNCRCALGFHGSTSNPAAGTEPAANLNSVLFWLDTSVDANWHIAQNNGAATSDLTTISNVAAADTNAHVFSLRAVEASTKFQYYYGAAVDGPPTGSSTWVDINTKIPAATSAFNYAFWMENIGSNTTIFDIYWIYTEVDC